MIGTTEYLLDSGDEIPVYLRRQLELLLATPAGSVVLDRDFGVDMRVVDQPPEEARTFMAVDLADKIERYIPELELREVQITDVDAAGNLNLKVVVNLADESS